MGTQSSVRVPMVEGAVAVGSPMCAVLPLQKPAVRTTNAPTFGLGNDDMGAETDLNSEFDVEAVFGTWSSCSLAACCSCFTAVFTHVCVLLAAAVPDLGGGMTETRGPGSITRRSRPSTASLAGGGERVVRSVSASRRPRTGRSAVFASNTPRMCAPVRSTSTERVRPGAVTERSIVGPMRSAAPVTPASDATRSASVKRKNDNFAWVKPRIHQVRVCSTHSVSWSRRRAWASCVDVDGRCVGVDVLILMGWALS